MTPETRFAGMEVDQTTPEGEAWIASQVEQQARTLAGSVFLHGLARELPQAVIRNVANDMLKAQMAIWDEIVTAEGLADIPMLDRLRVVARDTLLEHLAILESAGQGNG